MPFNPADVVVGPGTLYVAPLGSAEPTSITGAWPSGWVSVGYTDKGNNRSWEPTFQAIDVDEELWPIRNVPETYKGTVEFSFAERTARNLAISMNAGVGTSLVASTTGTNADGSVWQEPPPPGGEIRLMVGWDALPKGATNPAYFDQAFGRTIFRQCIQTGAVKETHQKGNNKSMFTVNFTLEYPATGLAPFRDIFPASLAA